MPLAVHNLWPEAAWARRKDVVGEETLRHKRIRKKHNRAVGPSTSHSTSQLLLVEGYEENWNKEDPGTGDWRKEGTELWILIGKYVWVVNVPLKILFKKIFYYSLARSYS